MGHDAKNGAQPILSVLGDPRHVEKNGSLPSNPTQACKIGHHIFLSLKICHLRKAPFSRRKGKESSENNSISPVITPNYLVVTIAHKNITGINLCHRLISRYPQRHRPSYHMPSWSLWNCPLFPTSLVLGSSNPHVSRALKSLCCDKHWLQHLTSAGLPLGIRKVFYFTVTEVQQETDSCCEQGDTSLLSSLPFPCCSVDLSSELGV